jgi:hypothetical protein
MCRARELAFQDLGLANIINSRGNFGLDAFTAEGVGGVKGTSAGASILAPGRLSLDLSELLVSDAGRTGALDTSASGFF